MSIKRGKNTLNTEKGMSKIAGVNNKPISSAVVSLNTEADVLDLSIRGFSVNEIVAITGLTHSEVRSAMSQEISYETANVSTLREQLLAKNLSRSEWLIKQVLKDYDPNDEIPLDTKTGNFILSVMKHQLDMLDKATPAQPTTQNNIQINQFTPTLSSNSPLMEEASAHLMTKVPLIFAPDETEPPAELPHGISSKEIAERVGSLEKQGYTLTPEQEEILNDVD